MTIHVTPLGVNSPHLGPIMSILINNPTMYGISKQHTIELKWTISPVFCVPKISLANQRGLRAFNFQIDFIWIVHVVNVKNLGEPSSKFKDFYVLNVKI